MRRCEIAVVGAGVVGLAAARALDREGFDVRLVAAEAEAPAANADDRRVYALAAGHAALFPEALFHHPGLAAFTGMTVWQAEPADALRFEAATVRAPRLGWIAPESVLRAALWQALPEARRITGVRVEEVITQPEGLTLWLDDGEPLKAALVLACDGAASPLRELAGIPLRRWTYDQEALVCTVRPERPHQGRCWQRFTAEGTLALLPLPDGACSVVWSSPQARTDAALSDEALGARLGARSQGVLGALRVGGGRATLPLAAHHAEQYVQGRLVLLGDAAHGVHPLAGQGLNLGLGDVTELVAQLIRARTSGLDWTSPRVLARYARARKAESREMIALTDALARSFTLPLPGVREVLSLGMAALDRSPTLKATLIRRAMGLAA